jgi:predicted DNA binding protein
LEPARDVSGDVREVHRASAEETTVAEAIVVAGKEGVLMVIWKYALKSERTVLKLSLGAVVLDARVQTGVLRLWVLVNPDDFRTQHRTFLVVGTGQPIDSRLTLKHISTALLEGGLVYHVFEII